MNKTYIGGLGTGALRIFDDGRTALCGAVKTTDLKKNAVDTLNPLSFALYAGDDLCRLLVCEENVTEAVAPECFEKTDDAIACRMRYELGSLSVDAEYVSPCILSNAVDSGIPAVFITFIIKNNTDSTIDFSLVGRVKSFFGRASARVDYFTKERAVFAGLSTADSEDEYAKINGIGLACDASDFTYAALPRLNDLSFLRTVRSGSGYLTNTGHNSDNLLLAAHERVGGNQSVTVRFVLTWHCPSRPDGEKSYYAHFFTDEAACAAYCFANAERLLNETEKTKALLFGGASKQLYGDALNGAVAKTGLHFLFRNADGTIFDAERGCGSTDMLFPNEYYASVSHALQKAIRDGVPHSPLCDDLMRLLRLTVRYLAFLRQTGEDGALLTDGDELTLFASELIKASQTLDVPLRDGIRLYGILWRLAVLLPNAGGNIVRKRKSELSDLAAYCTDKLAEACCEKGGKLSPLILSEAGKSMLYCGKAPFNDTLLHAAATDCRPDKDSPDYFMASALVHLGYHDKAASCAFHLHPMSKADGLMASVLSSGGFDYDAFTESLTLRPADRYADIDGITRSFFCVPAAFGDVEQGEDYIELRVRSGRLRVRSVNVSHKPYKVLYRGRLMPCVTDGNTVTLESAMIVDEERKLTVLVDTAK